MNKYVSEAEALGTTYSIIPFFNCLHVDTSSAQSTERIMTISGFALEYDILVTFKVIIQNGWESDFTLNINNTGAKAIKYYSQGQKVSLPASGYAGTVLELFYDGTDYVAINFNGGN